jgi:hypothetical protein
MTQQTQFLMTKGSDYMNVTDDDLATYLAAGWTPVNIRYSEGGEGEDSASQILMVNGTDAIRVRPDSVLTYRAQGYSVREILYGADALQISNAITVTDVPAIVSMEVGTVDATTLVITFLDDVAASDYKAGFTLKINDVAAGISAGARQTDHKIIYLTVDAVVFGDTVTLAYAEATGNITSEADGTILDDMAATAVTNNVPEA